MNLNDLNDRQKEAVLYNDGPLLIIAGAGAGKTKTLTTKIAYLIEEMKVNTSSILAITFTNKAAKEMRDRLFSLIGILSKNLQVSTFHSFGLRLIRENYDTLGYKQNFNIMDSEDSLTIVKKIIKEMNLDTKQYNAKAIRNRISSCKNDLVTPEDYKKYTVSDYEDVVYNVYVRYQKKLFENNSVDFDDLLILPIKLFKEHKDILERYQELFKYVLIDEYQDTNEAQYVLTKLISKKYQNITCVGDDCQSIYSFRGANYKNILNFEKDFKAAKTILLEQNYRSTSTILDAANDVIKNNKQKKDKKLWTDRGIGEKIKYYKAYNEIDESQYVVRNVKELIDKDTPLNEIAVLYRTNAQSRTIEEEMLKANIPYRVVGSVYFYSRKEIKDLMAYLRLIHNSSDNISFLRVINTPKRGIGLKTIDNLTKKADEQNISLYDAIDSGKELVFKNIIEKLKEESKDCTLTELIDKILNYSGMRDELVSEDTLESEIRLENLEEFKSITKTFEEEEGEVSLEDFLLEVSLISDVEEYRDDPNRVSLMTVHSVKGLEFSKVFVIGMEEGIFPHVNSLQSNSEVEEERRLCYVAITRAKDNLWLINTRSRTLYGQTQVNPTSRFIEEINRDLIEIESSNKEELVPKIKVEDVFHEETVDYKVGDIVYHETFGMGKVVDVSNELLDVAFKHPIGIKKLMKNHKKLSKV